MADPNTNISNRASPLVSTDSRLAAPGADEDSAVTLVAGRRAESHEKSPPPVAKKNPLRAFMETSSRPPSLRSQDDAARTDNKTGSGTNKLLAFVASAATSAKLDAEEIDESDAESGSVINQDAETMVGQVGTDTGVRPEPLGTLGRSTPPRPPALQSKIDDLEAKQVMDKAINGPPTFKLPNGLEVRGALALRLQAIHDSSPENAFRLMGGVETRSGVMGRVDVIQNRSEAKPKDEELIKLPPKPTINIPGRDENAFANARDKFGKSGTSALDKTTTTQPAVHDDVRSGPNVSEMIRKLQPKDRP
ncbi:hypothetical protein [Cognatiyoonia sp. IB215182]|uniref:hypothetical protein n=1 Tax=Cognatiyoonia sp. IB215182 TaxID=3097353 RepID=UPI002A1210B0|nr:hypothetical protein [Cognatiyoonia sp. IB215182]MDX8352624.1 hypothetical protein [Cognatiyoonia sp. IB215182]